MFFTFLSTKESFSKMGPKKPRNRETWEGYPRKKKTTSQGHPCNGSFRRVVTRYMGSGITASGSGSWTRDPGSQVMGSGSANFFLSWRGSRIDHFLDTLFFTRNKNIPFCKEKGLFSGLLEKLLTFILQFFYVSVTQSAV